MSKEPTNSEFIEGAKALLRQGANDAQWELATLLRKACDRLGASEQQPKNQQPNSEKEYSNSEFIKVQRLAAQLAIDAYEEDQEWCPTKTARLLDACDRLERAAQQRKDLLSACIKVQQYNRATEGGRLRTNNAHEYWESVMSYVEAAIAKDKTE